MNKNEICEAMYALPDRVIVKRRKPLLVPVLVLLAGAVLIVVNNVWGAELTNNLRSSLVFVGGALAVSGLLILLARMLGSDGIPYHRREKRFLEYEELYFDRECGRDVVRYVNDGDVRKVLALQRSRVPAVAVALYRTPDNRFAALQAFEYTDLEYRALSELKIVTF